MALTYGTGPFARPPGGQLNGDLWSFLPPMPYTHPVLKRLRAEVAGTIVLDTTSAVLLHETALPPVYYVPIADITTGVLEPSETVTMCPFKGTARYCHLRVGDRIVRGEPQTRRAATRPLPPGGLPAIEPVCRHQVRRHRIARTERAIVFETGIPARFYIPAEDVRPELTPTETRTHCPYKGECAYVSAAGIQDVAWVYAQPYDESQAIAGSYCLDPGKVTTELTAL